MSIIGSAIESCPQIQQDILNNFIQNADVLGAKEPQGFTDFVMSPTNTNGVLQSKINAGGGKYRSVELLYTNPVLESAISTSPAKLCVSTNEAGTFSKTYQIDTTAGVAYNEKFDLLNMAAMCKDNSLWFAQRVQAMMDGLVKKIGTINATQLALLYGAFASGDSGVTQNIKTVRTRKSSSNDVDLDAYEEIAFSAANNNYSSVPFIFGFGEIFKYSRKVAAGCCAAEGVDYGQYAANNAYVMVPDKKVYTALGSNDNFLMVNPGAVQFISWLEFEGANGINVIDDQAYKQTVITDPKTGIRFDFQLKNDCGTIHVNIKLAHKLVGLPADLYAGGDAFRGVTWVHEFAINNS